MASYVCQGCGGMRQLKSSSSPVPELCRVCRGYGANVYTCALCGKRRNGKRTLCQQCAARRWKYRCQRCNVHRYSLLLPAPTHCRKCKRIVSSAARAAAARLPHVRACMCSTCQSERRWHDAAVAAYGSCERTPEQWAQRWDERPELYDALLRVLGGTPLQTVSANIRQHEQLRAS